MSRLSPGIYATVNGKVAAKCIGSRALRLNPLEDAEVFIAAYKSILPNAVVDILVVEKKEGEE